MASADSPISDEELEKIPRVPGTSLAAVRLAYDEGRKHGLILRRLLPREDMPTEFSMSECIERAASVVGKEFLIGLVFDPELPNVFPRHEKVPPLLPYTALRMQRRPDAASDEEVIPRDCLAVYGEHHNVTEELLARVRSTLRRRDLPPSYTDVLVKEEMGCMPVPLAECYIGKGGKSHVVAAIGVDVDAAIDKIIFLGTMPYVISSLLAALKNHHKLAERSPDNVRENFSVLRIGVGGNGGSRLRQFYYAALAPRTALREPGVDAIPLTTTLAYAKQRELSMKQADEAQVRRGLKKPKLATTGDDDDGDAEADAVTD